MNAHFFGRFQRFVLPHFFLIVSIVGSRARAADPIETIGAGDPAALTTPVVSSPEIWKDPSQPLDARVNDLVGRMSLAEKASQLRADAAAIPRLGIPAYSYRNECLHGVVHTGVVATVFPQAIGMAATWDTALIHDEADAIATEGWAGFNDYRSKHNGNSLIHFGVTFYSPNINIVRDPRWGRGQETYGEDPFLTGRMAIAFIRGLQGDDPKYLKTLAGAKHYAVHSGPEPLRTYFDATPSERDLYETYLPAFEAAVREGHVGQVMGAYSALYGVPDCASPFLLTQVLRDRWGFKGFVVSDGGAILKNFQNHKFTPTAEDSAAVAVKAGCDLFSGNVAGNAQADYRCLGRMLQKNLLSEKEIDTAVSRTLEVRFRLGFFDPPSMVPWSKITMADNDTPEHQALALKVARESIVLLKNDGALPLDRKKIKRIAVVGENAQSVPALLGNYNGSASHPVTILDGIKQAAGPDMEVTYSAGCPLALKNDSSNQPLASLAGEAVAAARAADTVIYVGGIDSSLEAESRKVDYQGFLGGDRTRIELPSPQEDLLKALRTTGKPVIFVN
ncbi:MAG TPA: glycoside hydrolase family 3 N-terminal domain-containing protein, partial [Verrucomicrobiae bacterium]|nr:glycoside hydrolase family 3 N-terminal domain-containing protein [Verrucomicrobiae bacterium]